MPSFKILGYSDDLIEIEGDINEELYFSPQDNEFMYIACYDGTLLNVTFDDDGIWRFKLLAQGHAFNYLEGNNPNDRRAYSDVVYFYDKSDTRNRWFLIGEQFEVAQ